MEGSAVTIAHRAIQENGQPHGSDRNSSLTVENGQKLARLTPRQIAPSRARGGKRYQLVLIDPRPLSRACVSRLLEMTAKEFTILSVASPTELVDEHAQTLGEVRLIVFSVGAAPITKNGVCEGIRLLSRRLPEVPLIVLSDCDEVGSIMEALRHGVRGYIPTTLNPPVAIEALRLVRAGGTFFPADALVEALGQRQSDPPPEVLPDTPAPSLLEGFTPRQLEVLSLLREGKPNKIIAYQLDMQESTVKVHVRHIMKKLNATNRTQAAFLAQRLLSGEDGAASAGLLSDGARPNRSTAHQKPEGIGRSKRMGNETLTA